MFDNVPGDDIAGIEHAHATKPENVTNKAFLSAIFGDDAERAWVTDVHHGSKADWFGRRTNDCDVDAPGFVSGDTYFAVGVLRDGAPARATANWSHTPVIVVDDVGEKCKAPAVIAALGEPSYVLRTSLGSRQFGYILRAPIRDANTQARIMRAITIGLFGGVDPGHGDNVRYVRLPQGFNSKPRRMAEYGGKPQPVLLLEWHPGRRHEVVDLMMALDTLPGLNGGSAWSEADGATVTHRTMPSNLPRTLEEARATYLPRDYIFAAFDKLGRVVGVQGSQGYIEVRCPWEHTHTNKDDRSGWNPSLFLTGAQAFRCFHSDAGEDQSNDGIEAVLRVELDARDGLGSFDALKREALAAIFPPLSGEDAKAVEAAKPVRRAWRDLGSSAPVRALPARRVVSTILVRGAVTQLGSQPNAGKSQMVVNLVCSLAAERHDLFGEVQPFQRAGGAFVITNEDNADEFERRRGAFLKETGLAPADLKHPVFVNEKPGFRVVSRDDRFAPVAVTSEMHGLAEDIRDARAAGHDIAVVVVDTQAASFSGVEENDNTAMAQAGAVLGAWAEGVDVALLLLHHTTKDAGRNGSVGLTAMRGASAMGGSVRCAAQIITLSPEEEAKLPDDERGSWIKLQVVKASYAKFAGARWFRKVGVNMSAVDDAGNLAPSESTAACLYDPKGPKLGVDTGDDAKVFNALAAVIAASDGGEVLLSATSGKGNRACVLIAKALVADSGSGVKMQAELLRRGLLTEVTEPVPGRAGRTRSVLKPTNEGREFVRQWQDTEGGLTRVDDEPQDPEQLPLTTIATELNGNLAVAPFAIAMAGSHSPIT